jgi:GNAT superfamily N-acetyltransferase
MKIVQMEMPHIEAASVLLASRHSRERLRLPGLPERFGKPEHAAEVIKALLGREGAYGAAAVRGTELLGYMIGTVKSDRVREKHLWIDYAGAAARPGMPEVYRDLYAVLSLHGVEQGALKHYALVPAGSQETVEAWFMSGFGCEQVHAMQSLSDTDRKTPAVPEGITFRLAAEKDEVAVRQIATLIMEHQLRAPVWAYTPPEDKEILKEGYAGLLKDGTARFWLALKGGELLGFQVLLPEEESASDMLTPGSCVSLAVGGTVARARGTGIGRALVQYGMAHASRNGAAWCTADWRATNLEASRFWPKQGFLPAALRLFRQIDGRFGKQ